MFNGEQGGSCGKVLLLPGLACLTALSDCQNMTVSNETPDWTDFSEKEGKESPVAVSGPATLFSTHALETQYVQHS